MTRIASRSLPPGLQATTLHSFAGIKDGSGSLSQLLERIDGNPEAKERGRKTDVLVIDEVSMLSEKIFNYAEYIARNVRQESRSFGGIQVIASGDFFQLPPVPRYDDEGNFAFQSKLWDVVFPHTCLLKTVQRQREPAFIENCSERLPAVGSYFLAHIPRETGHLNCSHRFYECSQLVSPLVLFSLLVTVKLKPEILPRGELIVNGNANLRRKRRVVFTKRQSQ